MQTHSPPPRLAGPSGVPTHLCSQSRGPGRRTCVLSWGGAGVLGTQRPSSSTGVCEHSLPLVTDKPLDGTCPLQVVSCLHFVCGPLQLFLVPASVPWADPYGCHQVSCTVSILTKGVHILPCPPGETHVHGVGDAIQPSHPLSSPSLSTLNPSQHQGLFQ